MHKHIRQTRTAIRLLLACTVFGVNPFPGYAQTTWQTPPEPIASQLDTPQNPHFWVSHDNQWIIHAENPPLPSIAELAEPVVEVAGIRLNPQTREPANAYRYAGLSLQQLGEETIHPVTLPEGAQVGNLDWSFDSRYLAFTLAQPDGLELWVLDLEQNTTRRLTEPILNGTYGFPCDWLPADEGLICKVVPPQLTLPEAPKIPEGPWIEESLGQQAPTWGITGLLQSSYDDAQFEFYLASTLEHISLDGTRRSLTSPLLIDEATPSPDGQWILLETIHRPFSYQVPVELFPKHLDILNLNGETVYTVAELPLVDSIAPFLPGATRPGRHWVSWRSDRPATLFWAETLDNGDPQQDVDFRDAIYQLAAPFTAAPELLWQTEWRFDGITWGSDDIALGYEFWEETQQIRTWLINPSQPDTTPTLLAERDWQDAYNNPGNPITAPGDYGRYTLLLAEDGESIYLEGHGASPDGVYPFLDRWNLTTGKKTRLWQSQDPYYERVWELLDNEPQRFLTFRQSATEPPNLFLRDLDTSTVTVLTQYEDHLPWYADITRRVVRYEREDGVQLSATLYLPPEYEVGVDEPLPTLIWVYPEEFESQDTAGQVWRSENIFSRPYGDSLQFLLTQGYAILFDPTLPIIGTGGIENDTYVEQLLMGAEAAVNYLVETGISDPERIAVGGHSYGGFTTANLLAHSDLFCVGIARSGIYNLSLTPFGFQNERRNFWEAQDTYIRLSPFNSADDINEPLLLIHGAADENAIAYPIQSERLYQALRGLGGTVRWVELPLEGHGYESREAIGHTLWEMNEWLKRCDDPLAH